ncbi:MAG: NAD-dependent epimerase/dehydratase family protein [Bacteroidota bacterium]|nr:NAD-dependent epimerase/dehydratase family protein [Bacteroidota bacterium]MDP4231743.1 NAD-dependent epimerase/dehydratase family protein [Bacteroidota bacterium]MDP4243479.1 NAD-dependent epimerase/dehydratase family protein [Bacteroidota bacterium]MDP4289251.1 NAD-dependent epimerase/dehydratase family protein [Bacteroidota bacterium]
MKVLVTGASGFVGSHIADRLIETGHDVRALVRGSSSRRWLEGKPIEILEGRLLDAESLKPAVENVDAIIHVAGVTAAKNKQGFFEGNQLATRAILEAVRRYNPEIHRFVQCSSQTATGPSLDGQPVNELTPPHPITAYGQSKRAAEEECERARQDFPVTIVRLPATYGPRDTAILTFFQTVGKGLKPLIGMKDKRVNLLHVSDVAEGVRLALERDEAQNETYFIAGENQHTWREVSDLTAEIVNRKGLTVKLPHAVVYTVAGLSEFFSMFRSKPSVLNWEKGRDMVQAHWTCSTEKARRDLGYRQQVSLEDGIRDTVEWYRREGWM